MFQSARDSTSSRATFRNGNQVKNLSLKVEKDSGIKSIPAIKSKPEMFGLPGQCFSQELCY